MNASNDLPLPGPEEYAQCSALVAKVIIQDDHVFTAKEIYTARALCSFQWVPNVTDFLHVIAGIQHPDLNVPEAYAALVYVPRST